MKKLFIVLAIVLMIFGCSKSIEESSAFRAGVWCTSLYLIELHNQNSFDKVKNGGSKGILRNAQRIYRENYILK